MLFRKKTAVEKEQKKRKKEAKKALRKEKRQTRKDARADKKEARKEARQDKKEIRKSGLKGKEKREAKKEIRKGKRETVKTINSDKKSEIKEIKSEIKDVRRSLKIVLPKVPGNVAILRSDLTDKGLTIDDAFALLNDAHQKAREITELAKNYLQRIIDSNRSRWVDNWNNDTLLVTWFGVVNKPNQVKDVYNRLSSVDNRLNKKITIRLHPQRKATVSAQNNGTFFEPKTFKVFPLFFDSSIDEMASVIVHELMHLWFMDQKLANKTKVYGSTNARTLATQNATKARKSPENYEHFVLTFA